MTFVQGACLHTHSSSPCPLCQPSLTPLCCPLPQSFPWSWLAEDPGRPPCVSDPGGSSAQCSFLLCTVCSPLAPGTVTHEDLLWWVTACLFLPTSPAPSEVAGTEVHMVWTSKRAGPLQVVLQVAVAGRGSFLGSVWVTQVPRLPLQNSPCPSCSPSIWPRVTSQHSQ